MTDIMSIYVSFLRLKKSRTKKQILKKKQKINKQKQIKHGQSYTADLSLQPVHENSNFDHSRHDTSWLPERDDDGLSSVFKDSLPSFALLPFIRLLHRTAYNRTVADLDTEAHCTTAGALLNFENLSVYLTCVYLCVCVCACVRACVRACGACVRACVCAVRMPSDTEHVDVNSLACGF